MLRNVLLNLKLSEERQAEEHHEQVTAGGGQESLTEDVEDDFDEEECDFLCGLESLSLAGDMMNDMDTDNLSVFSLSYVGMPQAQSPFSDRLSQFSMRYVAMPPLKSPHHQQVKQQTTDDPSGEVSSSATANSVDDLCHEELDARKSRSKQFSTNRMKKDLILMTLERPFVGAVCGFDIDTDGRFLQESRVAISGKNLWHVRALLETHSSRVTEKQMAGSRTAIEYTIPVRKELSKLPETETATQGEGKRVQRKSSTRKDDATDPNAVYECRPNPSGGVQVRKLGNRPVNPLDRLRVQDPDLVEFEHITLRAPKGCRGGEQRLSRARCRDSDPESFFAPTSNEAKYSHQFLEVDLGQRMHVKAFSTSGKYIRTQPWRPENEDGDSNLVLDVVDPVLAVQLNSRENLVGFPSFELHYQVEVGAPLVFAGVLQGPRHSFDEHVQMLDILENRNLSDGLSCRILRIRPLWPEEDVASESHLHRHESPSMLWRSRGLRVAVFGYAPNAQEEQQRGVVQEKESVPGSQMESNMEDDVVRITLYVPKDTLMKRSSSGKKQDRKGKAKPRKADAVRQQMDFTL